MFDPSLPTEPDLRASISEDVGGLIRQTRPAAVWTCAATEYHADHRLTRLAVADAVYENGCELVLWEGLPYAFGSKAPAGIVPFGAGIVATADLERKIAAIAEYRSQIRMLWPRGEDWRAGFLSHARSRAIIRAPELLWNASGATEPDPSHSVTSGGQ
jgi:LmbE family N-acetylglucosaminyl deacetylase